MAPPHPDLQAPLERPQHEHDTCILDSGLDDIHVPSLVPLPCPTVIQPKRINHPSSALQAHANRELTLTPAPAHLTHPPSAAAPVTMTATTATTATTTATQLVPWDGKINWALNGTTVFKDSDEERRARVNPSNTFNRESHSKLWVFQFGLRYVPAASEQNVYRAIKVDHLPAGAGLAQILARIPGEILSARLLDTRAITGSKTALVTFVHQADAVRFLRAAAGGLPLKPGPPARVAPIPTPSYPISADMEKLIHDKGYTRCLRITHLRPSLKGDIGRALSTAYLVPQIESIHDGPGPGESLLRFCSIKAAAAAYVLLRGQAKFDECQWEFVKAARSKNPRIGIWD
ncbi:hypothetical protein BP00DRAFT_495758 [Aspergillus indologenus CBS 114.80]|uniref:Uncharacterized protein n=1 Tax=Aspergillus indologenus CBS 114.80 TaxID=1450541 RepID=A0A2V5I1G0_9EURO|nr:hypothetical protein BP00DRAFT_495758 [Aspergillus indologenus CBS 114.80]